MRNYNHYRAEIHVFKGLPGLPEPCEVQRFNKSAELFCLGLPLLGLWQRNSNSFSRTDTFCRAISTCRRRRIGCSEGLQF